MRKLASELTTRLKASSARRSPDSHIPSTERTPNRKAHDGLADETVGAVTPDTPSRETAGAAAHGGAGTAVAKALPSLAGKLTSNAIRVPVPNGSLVVLSLEVSKKTSIDKVNAIMKKYALEGELVEQIKYSLNNELVSSDIIGTSAPSIYDSKATIVSDDGKNIVLYIWYDNEYGYSHQVIRLAKYIAKVRRFTYY